MIFQEILPKTVHIEIKINGKKHMIFNHKILRTQKRTGIKWKVNEIKVTKFLIDKYNFSFKDMCLYLTNSLKTGNGLKCHLASLLENPKIFLPY